MKAFGAALIAPPHIFAPYLEHVLLDGAVRLMQAIGLAHAALRINREWIRKYMLVSLFHNRELTV